MNAPLPMLLCLAVLATLLAAALWHDLRTRRIPNRLVLWGTLTGLILNSFVPAGAGLFDAAFGGLGPLQALAGAAAGLALLLPMHLLRALGAGDVKLMAMVGAFIGPQQVLAATLLALLAGGVLSLLVAACTGLLRQVLANSYRMLFHSLLRGISGGNARLDAPQAASGSLPYAIAIAAGTALSFFWSFS